MKAILVSEERFDEMFDAFLNLLKVKSKNDARTEDELGLSYRTVHYYAHEFMDRVKKSAL